MTRLWSFLTGAKLLMLLLWLGLAAFSIAIVILIWTRWGQYRPLRKCFLLSLLAHLLLAGYATTIEIVAMAPAISPPVMHVTLLEWPVGPGSGPSVAGDAPATEDMSPAPSDIPEESPPAAGHPLGQPANTGPPPMPEPDRADPPRREDPPPVETPPVASPSTIASEDGPPVSPVPRPLSPIPPDAGTARKRGDGLSPLSPAPCPMSPVPWPLAPVPEVYRLRMAGDHVETAIGGGGSPETEAAVQAALAWLSANQNPDGRWEARRHEAGRDTMTDGRSRPNAGLEADSGMTGLALLTMLGSGHTHLRGPYRENVRRGLEFLLAIQSGDGSLAGPADRFAAMYCHAMAAFALSEAYAMTGDSRLSGPVHRAIGYTLAAQDPAGGGWRYSPRDPGDTSQLGWQLMALRSAELAGIAIPAATRANMVRYLQSVASGRQGGLASYRPHERPTRTMTAEALACWQFLGMARQHPAAAEAAEFLLGELPGQGRPNFYYWYYATLATFQLQGEPWQRWNDAMRTHLLAIQEKAEPLAGSWDPDPVWGGYGGRIYSTSLAALCLEAYYRYLPLWKVGAGGVRD